MRFIRDGAGASRAHWLLANTPVVLLGGAEGVGAGGGVGSGRFGQTGLGKAVTAFSPPQPARMRPMLISMNARREGVISAEMSSGSLECGMAGDRRETAMTIQERTHTLSSPVSVLLQYPEGCSPSAAIIRRIQTPNPTG
jgi:hypothetical protein